MPVSQPHPCYCFGGRCWKKHCPLGKANKESLIEERADENDQKDGRSYKINPPPSKKKV